MRSARRHLGRRQGEPRRALLDPQGTQAIRCTMEPCEPRALLSGAAPAVPNPGGAPNGPYALTATPNGNAIQVQFYDSADNEAGFVVERGDSANGPFTAVANLDASAGVAQPVTFTDTGVVTGHTYFYRAYAVNGPYVSSIDGPVSASLAGTTNPGGAPNGPYALTVALDASNQPALQFYDSADNETGFIVERSFAPDGPFTQIGTLGPSAGRSQAITFTDTNAQTRVGRTWFYRVYAINGPYASSIAGPVSVFVPGSGNPNPGGAPNGPYALTASLNGSNQPQLQFYDSADNESGFTIERGDAANGPFTSVGTLPASPGVAQSLTFTDTSAQPGHTYFYRVYAINPPYISSINGPVPITTGGGSTFAPDSTFRNGGLFTDARIGAAKAVAPLPGDKFLVLADRGDGTGRTVLIRYNPDGTRDTTFGNAGSLDLVPHIVTHGLAVQGDGKIVVAGPGPGGPGLSVVERFNPNGSLDTTFGPSGGSLTPGISNVPLTASDVAIAPDGDIVVGGTVATAGGNNFAATKLLPGGAPDTTWGPAGVSSGGLAGTATRVLPEADGSVVVLGTIRLGNSNGSALATRLFPNNTLGGQYAVPGAVFGSFADGSAGPAAGQFMAVGALDNVPLAQRLFMTSTSVGRDGLFGADLTGLVGDPSSGKSAFFNAVLVNPDGSILAAGDFASPGGPGSPPAGDTFLTRLTNSGAIDGTFANGGTLIADVGGADDAFTAIARLPDGRLITAGVSNSHLLLAKYVGA